MIAVISINIEIEIHDITIINMIKFSNLELEITVC